MIVNEAFLNKKAKRNRFLKLVYPSTSGFQPDSGAPPRNVRIQKE
jgi:hypothetical protein